jgi:hypothetical protein
VKDQLFLKIPACSLQEFGLNLLKQANPADAKVEPILRCDNLRRVRSIGIRDCPTSPRVVNPCNAGRFRGILAKIALKVQVETFRNLARLIVNVREHSTKVAHVEPLPGISCNDRRPFYEARIPSELDQP